MTSLPSSTSSPLAPASPAASSGADGTGSVVKLVLVGDSCVGKTNLINVMCSRPFQEHSAPTVGVEFSRKNFMVRGQLLVGQVWDTAGQERFRSLPSLYYRQAQGVLIVFDVTNRDSFHRCLDWINEVKSYLGESAPMVLVGNKVDLEEERTVTKEEAAALAKDYKMACGYVEATAKEGTNVYLSFQMLVEEIVRQRELGGGVEPDQRRHSSSKSVSKEKLRKRKLSENQQFFMQQIIMDEHSGGKAGAGGGGSRPIRLAESNYNDRSKGSKAKSGKMGSSNSCCT